MSIPRLKIALPLLAASLLGACTITETEEVAENARVVISGTAPDGVMLITSTKFTPAQGTAQAQLGIADTTIVKPPFERIIAVSPDRGFLARLSNPDSLDGPVRVRLQIYLDKDKKYDHETDLRGGRLEFSWVFF